MVVRMGKLRYWPYRGVGTCASMHNLVLQVSKFNKPWEMPQNEVKH